MRFEEIRQQFRPEKIKFLMIADSPPNPAKNYHFFYDVSKPDPLREAMIEAFGLEQGRDPKDFLTQITRAGFYLDDLCLIPINQITDPDEKDRLRRDGKKQLKQRLEQYIKNDDLYAITVISKEIFIYVKDAIEGANIPSAVSIYSVAFPNKEYPANRINFINGFRQMLIAESKKL